MSQPTQIGRFPWKRGLGFERNRVHGASNLNAVDDGVFSGRQLV